MTEITEDGKAVMKPYSQPALTSLYRNRTVLFSTAAWVEPNLGMKPLRHEKCDTMYAKAALKKRKTVR